MKYKLAIIGGGNMGQAILRGAIRAEVVEAGQVLVVDTDKQRRSEIEVIGCAATEDATESLTAEQIMLAVKPQVFDGVASVIAPLKESKIVISIMAGLSSKVLHAALGENARIIRVMPNTPCSVGSGMTAIALGEGAKSGDEALAESLFKSLGEIAIVDESLMHAVTAVSGSGPAYVFLLAEQMQKAAIDLGIDQATAKLLAYQTIFGAGKMLCESSMNACDLRDAVTSPGGTTQAAIEVMMKRDLPMIFNHAIHAAHERGVQLDQ